MCEAIRCSNGTKRSLRDPREHTGVCEAIRYSNGTKRSLRNPKEHTKCAKHRHLPERGEEYVHI